MIKIDIASGDPEPNKADERARYVAKTAGFFQEIGTDKVQYMINDLLKQMINPNLTDEQTKEIKLTINGLSLVLDWGDAMIAEQIANSQDEDVDDSVFKA